MTINRRHAIRQFVLVSAGLAIIPACMQNNSKASVICKNLAIDGNQEKLLAELSETIIPTTDTPGAKDIAAHLFVLKMVDDCYSKEDQQKFMKGLTAFNTQCKAQTGDHFIDCTSEKRTVFLQQTEASHQQDDNLLFFYTTVKKHTIQAYTSSKFYLTKISIYKMIPGPYHGCVEAPPLA